jgi:hypothetical protein
VLAKKAFQAALGVDIFRKKDSSAVQGLSIKGSASAPSTAIEVDGLAPGTTAEDVAVSHIALDIVISGSSSFCSGNLLPVWNCLGKAPPLETVRPHRTCLHQV